MFLNRKSLLIQNIRRVKNHLDSLKNKAFKEVEEIIENEELTLEQQDSENLEIFQKAYTKILREELEFWQQKVAE